MTPEGKVKEKVKQLLKSRGIWYFMPQNIGMGVSGVPDFICCLPQFNGKLLGIETKAPGKLKNLTALQQRQIDLIRAARGWAIVIDDVASLEGFLNDCCADAQGTCSQGHKP